MQRFNVYKKSKKIYWSKSSIIFILMLSLYIIQLLKQHFINEDEGLFEEIIMKLIFGLFMLLFIFKTIGLVKVKPTNKELCGFLEFYKDYIVIDEEKFKIDEIKSIEISNNDYYGKPNGPTDFESSLSNGINNQILLRFNSGISKSYNFELYNECDMEKVEEELFSYYSQGKIDFFELTKILKIQSKTEIEDFRNKIALLK